jgi:broad specificity phosphatase PhoE
VATIRLVRHGQAAAGWGDHRDPPLDDVGREQAEVVAVGLASFGPLPIVTSPMLRCQQTAAPLASRWGCMPLVEPDVGEVTSPVGDLDGRVEWLRGFLSGTWATVDDATTGWRDRVLDWTTAAPDDCVVFSHFVAINAVIGHATGDDRVTCRRIANTGVTTISNDGGRLVLLDAPTEAVTEVR